MAERRIAVATPNTPVGQVDANGMANPVPTTLGQSTGFATLVAVTTNATGATMDCGTAKQMVSYVCVGTGTLAGTLTCQGSLDNVTFVSVGVGSSLTAAATVGGSGSGKLFRYYRVNLSAASGTGTATCTIMANG